MSQPEPAPPISPADADPTLEARDRAKDARLEDVISARRELRAVRRETQELRHRAGGRYPTSAANSEYLGALQDLIIELEPFYQRLQTCPEYWRADIGDPLAVLERPALDKTEIIDEAPECLATGGRPEVINRDALEAEVLGAIYCLPELLELEDATVAWSAELHISYGRDVDVETYGGHAVISRTDLDRARRWCLAFMERAGLSLGSSDDRDRGRIGGDARRVA